MVKKREKQTTKKKKQTRWQRSPLWLKTGIVFFVIDFISTAMIFILALLEYSSVSLQNIASWTVPILVYFSFLPFFIFVKNIENGFLRTNLLILISFVAYFLIGSLVGLIIQKFKR